MIEIFQKEEKTMVTDTEHIEALRRRLFDRQKEKENELREIQEMIRVLGSAPKLLSGAKSTAQESQERESAPSAKYNMNLSKQVDDYLSSYAWDEAINISGMIKTLKAEQGVKGKDKSLYAYIHALLKKKTQEAGSSLRYEKGVGFFKTRKSDRSDSELVASA